MKILLIKPYGLTDHIQPPLGLGYLASSLRNNHEVELLDCMRENAGLNATIKRIKDSRPDMVGLQCYTFQLETVKDILCAVKDINPLITTVVGGPHPSASPNGIFDLFAEACDYGFVGEAEIGLPLLAGMIEKGHVMHPQIPGLIWRDKEGVVVNPQVFPEDLDNLGSPAWDILKPEGYPQSQHGAFFKRFPIAPIMATRGCPYPCTFCAGSLVTGKRLRKRSAASLVKEVRMLYSERGIREFHMVDDNFTMDIPYAKDFLRALKEEGLDISWATPNGIRIDALDDELLGLMKQTGLYLVSLGIESGSDRVLGLMKKGFKTDDVRCAVKRIRSSGIDVAGFFIMGFPGETPDDIKATIDFSLELDLIRANYFLYLPLPGTESFNELARQGRVKTDYSNFHFTSAFHTPDGMTKRQLKGLQRKAFFSFFLRPRIFFKNLIEIKSPRHFLFLAKRFVNWIIKPV